MKGKGSICWMTEERDHSVIQVYKSLLRELGFSVSRRELYRRVAQHRTSRFWVVPASAKRTLYRMMYGPPILNQSPERKRMYSEILCRVRDYMQRNHSATLGAAINYVIQQPAPEFYLSVQTVKRIINYDAHHRQI